MPWPRESKWMLYTSILMRSLTQSPRVSLSLNLEDKGCISRQNGGWRTGSAGGPVAISGAKTRYWSVTNGVPRCSITQPMLLKVFSNSPGDGTECVLSKFVDNKLEKAVNVSKGRAATQRNLDKF